MVIEKKKPLAPPKKFKGAWGEDFDSWMAQVKRNFRHEALQFSSDQSKLDWVSGYLEGHAAQWFLKREKDFAALGAEDSWLSFEAAFTARFKDERSWGNKFDEMENLKYKDSIEVYITKLEELNLKVGLEGKIWQRMVYRGLPENIVKRIPITSKTTVPDDEFRRLVVDAGLRVEDFHRMKTQEESRKKKSAQEYLKEHPKEKGGAPSKKRAETSAGPSRTREVKDREADRGSKYSGRSSGGFSRPTEDRKSSRPFASRITKPSGGNGTDRKKSSPERNSLLKGIPQQTIETRMSKGECARCGRSSHRWRDCKAKAAVSAIAEGSSEASSSRRKRKAEDASEVSEGSGKKAKVAGVAVEPRIWEIDSDTEAL
jgi:hypothetical protein